MLREKASDQGRLELVSIEELVPEEHLFMKGYESAVSFWIKRNVRTGAELAEVLNGHSIAFAYHSGKYERDI